MVEKRDNHNRTQEDYDKMRVDVKIAFVLDDYVVKDAIEKGKYKGVEAIAKAYVDERSKLESLSEGDLEKKLNGIITERDPRGGPKRIERYDSRKWDEVMVQLSNVATWHKMRGLPIEATTGNLDHTADYVRPYVEGKEDAYEVSREFGETVDKLKEMLSDRDRLKYSRDNTRPILLLEREGGDEIRNHHNNRADKSRRPKCDMADKNGFKYWTPDNGNLRLLAYSLADYKVIPAYVGIPKPKENYNVDKKAA